ncbi:MAG: aminotransferase class IV family protein, partial [Calditrichaeota bacterium]|nr:aminotransferase class IV family protein [Calditrichota bacterium]
MKYVIYNHRLIEREKIKIPIDDRSFRFGDGCFETVLFRNATCFYLDKHLDRLKKSLSLLSIQLDITSIADEILRLIDANKIRDGILRVIVSRGISSSGYLPVKSIPYYLIETVPNQFQTPDKVSLFVSKWRKPAAESIPVHAKYSANINSILARIEANENNCFESLQLTSDGFISECSSANIAWIKDDRLFSPSDE